MVKAKLATLTEKWIDGKTERQSSVKTATQKTTGNEEKKIKQTLYISSKAAKLLWHNRVETRTPISRAVEQLVIKHLGKRTE